MGKTTKKYKYTNIIKNDIIIRNSYINRERNKSENNKNKISNNFNYINFNDFCF